MRIYIAYSKTNSGVRTAYACVGDDFTNFYYRRFDKNTGEQEVFDYIMSYVNDFADKSNESIFVISNNNKMVTIMGKMKNTENISFIGRYDSEQARDIFIKLQVALTKKERSYD